MPTPSQSPTMLPGQRVLEAKRLFDSLDTSTMSADELALHATLKQRLESQPAIQASTRVSHGAAGGPVTPTDPSSFSGMDMETPLSLSGGERSDPTPGQTGSALLRGAGAAIKSVLTPRLNWLGPIGEGIDIARQAQDAGSAAKAQITRRPDSKALALVEGVRRTALAPVADLAKPTVKALSGESPSKADKLSAVEATGNLGAQAVGAKMLPGVARGVGRVGRNLRDFGAVAKSTEIPAKLYASGFDNVQDLKAASRYAVDEGLQAPVEGGSSWEGHRVELDQKWNDVGRRITDTARNIDAVDPRQIDVRGVVRDAFDRQIKMLDRSGFPRAKKLELQGELEQWRDGQLEAAAADAGAPDASAPILMTREGLVGLYRRIAKTMSDSQILGDQTNGTLGKAMQDLRNDVAKHASASSPELAADMRGYHLLNKMKEGFDAAYRSKVGGPQMEPLNAPNLIGVKHTVAKRLMAGPGTRLRASQVLSKFAPEAVTDFDPATGQRMRNFPPRTPNTAAGAQQAAAGQQASAGNVRQFFAGGGGSPRRAPNPATAPPGTFAPAASTRPITPQVVPRAPAALEAAPARPQLPAASRSTTAAYEARMRQTAADVESSRRVNAEGPIPLGGAVEPPRGPIPMPGRISPKYNAERTAAFQSKQSAGTPTPDFPQPQPQPKAAAPKPPLTPRAPKQITGTKIEQSVSVPKPKSPPVSAPTTRTSFNEGDAITLPGDRVATIVMSDAETTVARAGNVTLRIPTSRLLESVKSVEPAAQIGSSKNPSQALTARAPSNPSVAPAAPPKASPAAAAASKPPPVASNPLERQSRGAVTPRKMTAAEAAGARVHPPKPASAASLKHLSSSPHKITKASSVAHSIQKSDGSTLHVIDNAKTPSGRTVVIEPADGGQSAAKKD